MSLFFGPLGPGSTNLYGFEGLFMEDTATMSAALAPMAGPWRELAKSGHVLLYGSSNGSGDDNDHKANPQGFKGIMSSSKGIDMVPRPTVREVLHVRYAPTGGARNENDTLPGPGNNVSTTMIEPLRYQYQSFEITGQLKKAAEKGISGHEDAFKKLMKLTATNARIDLNRQAFGNGSGVISTIRVNEAAAQTVIDVTTTVGFRVGSVIDGVTISTGVVIEPARIVTAIDLLNRQITVSPALTTGLTANTDGWVNSSPDGASTVAAPNNSWNREVPGLDAIVDSTGTLHSISPAVYPEWASYEAGAIGAISDSALRTAKRSVGYNTGIDEAGDMKFLMVTTRGIRDAYADTQMALKRHVNTQTLNGGFDAIMFDSVPIVTDDHCQPGSLYMLRTPELQWKIMSDWDWMDDDGAILNRVLNKDAYRAIMFMYGTFVTYHRGAHAKLTGITEPGGLY